MTGGMFILVSLPHCGVLAAAPTRELLWCHRDTGEGGGRRQPAGEQTNNVSGVRVSARRRRTSGGGGVGAGLAVRLAARVDRAVLARRDWPPSSASRGDSAFLEGAGASSDDVFPWQQVCRGGGRRQDRL